MPSSPSTAAVTCDDAESASAPSAREPKVSEVPLLAKALGVSVASLFGEAQVSQSARPDPAILASTYRFLVDAFATLGKAVEFQRFSRLFRSGVKAAFDCLFAGTPCVGRHP